MTITRLTRAGGYTYTLMLFTVAASSALLAATSIVWHTAAVRAREAELLVIGEEFRRAIGLYYERTPGAVKRYPERLEDLLHDARYLSTQRYLRRIYRDPITGGAEWGLVAAPEGGIMGVHSLSGRAPMKTAGYEPAQTDFAGAAAYSSWRFVYRPAVQAPGWAPAADREPAGSGQPIPSPARRHAGRGAGAPR